MHVHTYGTYVLYTIARVARFYVVNPIVKSQKQTYLLDEDTQSAE